MIDLRKGDCLELMKTIPDKSIDLIVTDPPYLHIKGGCKSKGLNRGCREATSNVVSNMSDFDKVHIYTFLNTVKTKVKEMNAYIFSSKLQVPYYLNWALENKCQFDILIWDKDFTGIISRKFFANNSEYIIRIYKKGLNRLEDNMLYQKIHKFKRPIDKIHEAQKPVELLERFIKLSSKEKDIVFDPFMGSGTTGIACINTNRNFIGIELDEKYFNITKDRIENCNKQLQIC